MAVENGKCDLISRERLRKMIKATKKQAEKFRNQDYWTGYVVALSTMEGVIADIPSVDAVPVVRCNMCRYYETNACYCSYHDDGMRWDGFCSCGAKMDEEESNE